MLQWTSCCFTCTIWLVVKTHIMEWNRTQYKPWSKSWVIRRSAVANPCEYVQCLEPEKLRMVAATRLTAHTGKKIPTASWNIKGRNHESRRSQTSCTQQSHWWTDGSYPQDPAIWHTSHYIHSTGTHTIYIDGSLRAMEKSYLWHVQIVISCNWGRHGSNVCGWLR